jgi:hypothetical protein
VWTAGGNGARTAVVVGCAACAIAVGATVWDNVMGAALGTSAAKTEFDCYFLLTAGFVLNLAFLTGVVPGTNCGHL